ncbi:MAG: hypothetical protein ACXVB9_10305 [Bdellovibrionota bacterium]
MKTKFVVAVITSIPGFSPVISEVLADEGHTAYSLTTPKALRHLPSGIRPHLILLAPAAAMPLAWQDLADTHQHCQGAPIVFLHSAQEPAKAPQEYFAYLRIPCQLEEIQRLVSASLAGQKAPTGES